MKLKSLVALSTLLFASAQAAESFHAEAYGEGAPIILIPGLSCDQSVWQETVDRYKSKNQIHALSIKGFGKRASTERHERLIDTVTHELHAYIQENQLHDPVIVGHSLGGFIALNHAIHYPDTVSRLLIVDSLPFLPAAMNPAATVETVKQAAQATREQVSQQGQNRESARQMLRAMITDPSNIERALDISLASDPSIVAQAMYEMNTTDLRPDVSKISARTVVLGAWFAYQQFGSTKESTAAIFDNQYEDLENYELHMSETGKHFLMWDDPELFYAQLDALLQQ
ncbi:alpha/beta hydrolase [Pelagicoccus sp. SDUM812003]|uniref:alpha/beta fold hydrolase n=1 Tax=Pelagicoccus sp. SDUM812003 TaxID=3041267 RepID=UPI00280F3ECA|nr:alpha/beta hydrolase [Pelagicoccus sp. SDUM812003]MDQ8203416.1 alpha/beta hydrolase [Pelagicoccus sp. SDUM812003]